MQFEPRFLTEPTPVHSYGIETSEHRKLQIVPASFSPVQPWPPSPWALHWAGYRNGLEDDDAWGKSLGHSCHRLREWAPSAYTLYMRIGWSRLTEEEGSEKRNKLRIRRPYQIQIQRNPETKVADCSGMGYVLPFYVSQPDQIYSQSLYGDPHECQAARHSAQV
jgi:hypothetical protein